MTAADAPHPLPPRGLVGSVTRAFKVLEIVADSGDGIPAKAVARRAGLKLSTTYHLLHTLVHEGYLVRLEHARGYGLGYKVAGLHEALRRELVGSSRVTSALAAAHQAVKAPMYFGVFRGDRFVIAEVADSPQAPRATPLDVGFDEAPHASAYGKVLLAHLPPTARREYLASTGMRKLTKNTVTKIGELEEELAEIRAAGMALETEQFQRNLACVAAPVRSTTGDVIGTVAASSPVPYFMANQGRMLAAVRTVAASL